MSFGEKQSALDIELDAFDGYPLDFHYFTTLFHNVVEDTSREIQKSIPYNGRIQKEDQGMANHKKW